MAYNDWPLEDGRVIELLTLDELKTLPDGITLTCIDGTTAVTGKDRIDTDTRAGYVAFGRLKAGSHV